MSEALITVKDLRYLIKGLNDQTIIEFHDGKFNVFKSDHVKKQIISAKEIKRLFVGGETPSAIAKKCGCSKQVINYWINKLELT